MATKLTVALTTYNRSAYLKYAIEGILKQSYKHFAFFIIDNASTDNTYEIVKGFHDKRITYIKNKIHLSPINNLNRAFNICSSEYLLITHDDDIMKEDFLERELAVLENDKNIAIVSTNMELIDERGASILASLYPLKGLGIHTYNRLEFMKDFCIGKKYIACPTVMFRISFVKKHHLKFDPRIGPAADSYLWMKINALDVKIAIIKESLYKYRIHKNQDNVMTVIPAHFKLFQPVVSLLKKNNLDEFIPPLQIDFFNIIFYSVLVQYSKNKCTQQDVLHYFGELRDYDLWPKTKPFHIGLLIILMYLPDYIIKPILTLLYTVKKKFSLY